MWGRIWWAANNRKWITVVLKRVSVLCVNASWEWRTRTSSRCIKNRLADFGTIKPPTFLNPFISSSSFTYFVFYFVCYVRIFVQFQTIWIKTDSIRASMCVWAGRRTGRGHGPPVLWSAGMNSAHIYQEKRSFSCLFLIIHVVISEEINDPIISSCSKRISSPRIKRFALFQFNPRVSGFLVNLYFQYPLFFVLGRWRYGIW